MQVYIFALISQFRSCIYMRKCLVAICLVLMVLPAFAQDKDLLFGPVAATKSRKGFILNGNAGIDIPAGDMAKRFGVSYRVGPALLYKTTSNWLFGAKFDFIVGKDIREDSLMVNIRDKYSANSGQLYEFIDNSGQRTNVPVFERGYAVGINVGKIIPFSELHPDNGLLLLSCVGFMQHRINIFDRDKTVTQLRGDYLKGYDRLTNGLFLEQYAGYTYFAKNGLLNFHIGVDALFGFTQCRRDFLYDVMRTDNKQRLDILFGLRGGWYIPMFRRKSEDLIFE